MRRIILTAAIMLTTAAVWAADTPATTSAAAPGPKTVTIDASNTPVTQVLADIAKSTGETILVEKLVSGDLTASIKDVGVEEALKLVTKTAKLQWRKVYVAETSVLAKDADALAAQMRTVLALQFPDIVISNVGSGGSFVHVQREQSANEIIKTLPPAVGFKKVYLVTDDRKAYEKEVKDESKQKIKDYVSKNKELMDSFLKMSPEERKAVLRQSIDMQRQLDPNIMAEVLSTVMDMDPEFLAQQNKAGMEAMMRMSPEARKNLLRASMRSQMQSMQSMPPELMQELKDIAMELAAEMGAGGGAPGQ